MLSNEGLILELGELKFSIERLLAETPESKAREKLVHANQNIGDALLEATAKKNKLDSFKNKFKSEG